MTTVKNVGRLRKVPMTKFQKFSIIFLLYSIVCDSFLLHCMSLFCAYLIGWFCLYFLQLVFCIVCLCKNYTGFCLNLRKSEDLQQSSFPLKPQSPAFLHFWFHRADLLVEFCLAAFGGVFASFAFLEFYFPVWGITITMITIIAITLFVIAGNLFQFQDTTKTKANQSSGIKNLLQFLAIKRIPFLKIFLKLDLVINGILCIYTFCTNCATSILLVAHYLISLLIAAVSLHYTVSNITTTLDQKKIRFHGLFRFFFEAIDAFFCGMLPFGYVIFCLPFPFWSYFLVYSALAAYTLLLNRFGKYPFIDYELFDPKYFFCSSDLYPPRKKVDVYPYCEFGKGSSQRYHCPLEPEWLLVWNGEDK